MRARILTLLLTSTVFALASQAPAATVYIDSVRHAYAPPSWELAVTTNPPRAIGEIALRISNSLTFTPSPLLGGPAICAMGSSCVTPIDAHFDLLDLTFTPALFSGSGTPVLLGTFSSADTFPDATPKPADDLAGGTVFDATGTPILDFTIRYIPEPAEWLLLAVTLAGVLLRRARS